MFNLQELNPLLTPRGGIPQTKKDQPIVFVNYKKISCISSQLICSVFPFMFSCLLASDYYFRTSSQEAQYCQDHSVFLEKSSIPRVFYLRVHKKCEWCLILCTAGKICLCHVILSSESWNDTVKVQSLTDKLRNVVPWIPSNALITMLCNQTRTLNNYYST